MSKIISPCIGICKYKLHGCCSGCGMRKAQKKAFKRLETPEERKEFLFSLISCQKQLNVHKDWARLYQKKYKKRGKKYPRDLKARF